MTVAITPIYAAIVALLMAGLSMHVGMMRGRYGVALGDGGARPLALSIRRFGNLSEYAAMLVLLMLVMELTGTAARTLHLYGIAIVLLRLIHPIVLFDDMAAPLWRKAGRFVAAGGTALLLVLGAAAILL
ncbi:MAPEG family protein [Jannaschia sp. KMU-145]|uniref:MAPEG family protein n=1 Tax=Jannaschia halovivens TaxID=3388667 RepID=UPI00396AF507